MFRWIDWMTFAVTAIIVFTGYMLSRAPNVTLEDSGELAVGSFYAGVPHPPGYPFWSILTWLFTELIPFKNVAWRVSMESTLAGVFLCALIAMMISRGSSMLIESIEEFKDIPKKWENPICLCAGYVGGLLMAFNGFMWSQCVIVEVYSLAVFSFILMSVFLMRWMYAPHQNRYLYLALFMFGLCFTNHQSLLMAAVGVQVAIIASNPRVGRDMLFFNSIIFIIAQIMRATGHLKQLENAPGSINMIYVLFNIIGVGSMVGLGFLSYKTKKLLTEFKTVFYGGLAYVGGVSFYLFMPLSSMSNPPMNWGYARTVEGFIHAFTRGQYEKFNPSNLLNDPARFVRQMWEYFGGMVSEFSLVYLTLAVIPFVFLILHVLREGGMKHLLRIAYTTVGMLAAFCLVLITAGKLVNLSYLFWIVFFILACVNLVFLMMMVYDHMQKIERAWLVGLSGVYFCLSVLLLIMLNPAPDRQSQELNRVFLTSSHAQVAMFIGYGLALAATALLMQPARFRKLALTVTVVAAGVALYSMACVFANVDEPGDVDSWISSIMPEASKSPIKRFTALYGVGVAVLAMLAVFITRARVTVGLLLGVYLLMPLRSVVAHWADNEQFGHMFGYWFGHDMFTPPFKGKDNQPLYPEMTRDAVLFGGTDPGRFCPTYMIFCESFIKASQRQSCDPNFDRRDVYLITQNALADGTYLNYIRAHYNRSAQIDPPFFQEVVRVGDQPLQSNLLSRMVAPLDTLFLGLGDRIEKRRRAGSSFFQDGDFTDLAGFARKLNDREASPFANFIKQKLSPATVQKLGTPDKALAHTLAEDLNGLLESGLLYESNRFAGINLTPRTQKFLAQNPQSHTRIRLNRLLLEEAFPKEIAKSLGGVYPDREIITPSPMDSQRCFQEYLDDVQKRLQKNQLHPGEDVRVDGGRVQVSGQVAVMAINGLLTKVIFDQNPNHEFFVEESFPLEWMYPYLTPFGIIMKINRRPLSELPQEVIDRDHEFWSQYSERTVGNWITYDTPVSNICHFAEKVYLHRDYSGFTGDPKFIRDDDAQKAFSKLRSSIAGIYNWRVMNAHSQSERDRMLKEAEFAFKQALAYCPYSPEAVFRYVNLLLGLNQANRIDDAILIAKTFKRLDPGNGQVTDLIGKLTDIRKNIAQTSEMQGKLGLLEANFRADGNVSNAFALANVYMATQKTNQAVAVLGQALVHPSLDYNGCVSLANAFVTLNNVGMLEQALLRLVKLSSTNPESWYDLAGVQAIIMKNKEALESLEKALDLSNARLKEDNKSRNLYNEMLKDPRFNNLRGLPEFAKLLDRKP